MKRRHFLSLATAGAAGWITAAKSAANETPATSQGDTDDSRGSDAPVATDEVTYTRKIPVRYQADVAVIGGGIAGVSAACAAARSGARVVLKVAGSVE